MDRKLDVLIRAMIGINKMHKDFDKISNEIDDIEENVKKGNISNMLPRIKQLRDIISTHLQWSLQTEEILDQNDLKHPGLSSDIKSLEEMLVSLANTIGMIGEK